MLKICQNWQTIGFSMEFKVLNRVENKKSSKTQYSCILHVNYNNHNNFLAWSDRFWKRSYIFCWKMLCKSYFKPRCGLFFKFFKKISFTKTVGYYLIILSHHIQVWMNLISVEYHAFMPFFYAQPFIYFCWYIGRKYSS